MYPHPSQSEPSANASHQNFSEILDTISDGFLAVDQTWQITFASPKTALLLHWTEDQSGTSLWLGVPDCLDTPFGAVCRRVMSERRPLTTEFFDQAHSKYLMVSVYPMADGLVITFNDNTAQRRTEMKYHKLEEADLIGLVVTSGTGRISEANDAFLSLIGYSREDFAAGRLEWRNLTPPDALHLDNEAVRQAMSTGRFKPFRKNYIHKQGHLVPVFLGGSLLDSAEQDAISYVLDMSDQKQVEDQLQAALLSLQVAQANLLHNEKMASMGLMAAGMTHEINNPITIIQGHLEFLELIVEDLGQVWQQIDRIELSEASAKLIAEAKARVNYERTMANLPITIEAALTGCKRIRQIIADLRTFSLDVNHQAISSDKFTDGLLATVNLVQSQFRGRVDFVAEFDDLPDLLVNGGQINQVVTNLLMNAGQATLGTGVVRLHTALRDQEIVISISDEGIGIMPEIQNKIFDPFFTTKPIGEGMGLGLSICYAVVQAHGGRIEMESQVGCGAAFHVYLPVSGLGRVTAVPAT
ncbi:MAG: PAS domain S-box protein [Candidatus Sericytochromatia bacterium]|nr:PAS domain S-box protein [Candidatus Sericytochromatia bacterium]